MVTSIARQSVILKCIQKRSTMLGNYEFYYAAGLLTKLYDLPLTEEMQPEEMLTSIQEALPGLKAKDDLEEYLLKMLTTYETVDVFDEQTKELFRWGANEQNLWSVRT